MLSFFNTLAMSILVIFNATLKFFNTLTMPIALPWCSNYHSTNSEFRFCAASNSSRGMSDACDGENVWQLPRLEIRLNAV